MSFTDQKRIARRSNRRLVFAVSAAETAAEELYKANPILGNTPWLQSFHPAAQRYCRSGYQDVLLADPYVGNISPHSSDHARAGRFADAEGSQLTHEVSEGLELCRGLQHENRWLFSAGNGKKLVLEFCGGDLIGSMLNEGKGVVFVGSGNIPGMETWQKPSTGESALVGEAPYHLVCSDIFDGAFPESDGCSKEVAVPSLSIWARYWLAEYAEFLSGRTAGTWDNHFGEARSGLSGRMHRHCVGVAPALLFFFLKLLSLYERMCSSAAKVPPEAMEFVPSGHLPTLWDDSHVGLDGLCH